MITLLICNAVNKNIYLLEKIKFWTKININSFSRE